MSTMNDPATILDTMLEELFSDSMRQQASASFAIPCQSKHTPSKLGATDDGCSVTVTHVVRTGCKGQPDTLICLSRTAHLKSLQYRGALCPFCRNRMDECWSILPWG